MTFKPQAQLSAEAAGLEAPQHEVLSRGQDWTCKLVQLWWTEFEEGVRKGLKHR